MPKSRARAFYLCSLLRRTRYRASINACSFLCVCAKASATSSASCTTTSSIAALCANCTLRISRDVRTTRLPNASCRTMQSMLILKPTPGPAPRPTTNPVLHLGGHQPSRFRRVSFAGLHQRRQLAPLARQRAAEAERRLPVFQPRLQTLTQKALVASMTVEWRSDHTDTR